MTANGNAFHAFTEDAVSYIAGIDALEYYRQPLPSEFDARFLAMVERYRAASATERALFIEALSASQRSLFGLFAHRAATMAVREENEALLQAAFLAVVIANKELDPTRTVELLLAVLHHCARKLGQSPSYLFDWAATFADEPLATRLEAFGHLEDVTLKKYGWVERRTPDGVQYAYQWR